MAPWSHVQHACCADASDLWLRVVAQDAHSGNHAQPQVAGITGSFIPWPLGPMCSSEFRVLKAWVVVCVFFATLQRSATFFEFVAVIAVTGRLKIVRQGRARIRCCGEGAGGGRTTSTLAVRVWLFGSSGPSHLCGWDSPALMWGGLYG